MLNQYLKFELTNIFTLWWNVAIYIHLDYLHVSIIEFLQHFVNENSCAKKGAIDVLNAGVLRVPSPYH